MQAMKALKSLAVVAMLSLSLPGLNIFSAASANARMSQGYQGEITALNDGGEYLVASALTNCRRVNTKGGRLFVRSSPNGRIVGALRDGDYVRIINRGANGWVPVAAPVNGYVYARYLTYCR